MTGAGFSTKIEHMFDTERPMEPDWDDDPYAVALTALTWAEMEQVDAFDNDALTESYEHLRRIGDLFHAQAQRRLAAVDERQTFARDGYTSTTAYLTHRFRTTGGRAKRLVAEARALQAMPTTRHLAEVGRLSPDQVSALVAAQQAAPEAFDQAEAELCEMAEALEWVTDLRKATAYWQQAVAPEPDSADQRSLTYLFASRTFENMVKLDGLFDAERGAQLLEALTAATPPPDPEDPSTPAQRRADALFDLVMSASGQPATPTLLVHVDASTLAGGTPTLSEIGDTVLHRPAIERLACDARIRRIVFGPESELLDVGRARRLVTGPMREAVIARDRHCAFPGCRRPAEWCDVHHIEPWWAGGTTSVANGLLLCRRHHTLIHEERFSISGPGHQPVFRRSDGDHLERIEYLDTG